MTIKELRRHLKRFPLDMEVFLPIPTAIGNISSVSRVKKTRTSFFGKRIPAVIIEA